MENKICNIRNDVLIKKPLIHCITNPISINGCANTILAVGAKPVMAEHPKEVCEITHTADALMLNTGNITDARVESILLSAKCANDKGIPILLDAVGIACSKFRKEYVSELLRSVVPSVIKGNYSEISALYNAQYFSPGVDADESLDTDSVTNAAKELALKYSAVVLATGKVDIITDGKKVVYAKNGESQLACVTGTGCMLGALCTAFLTVRTPLDGAVAACVYMGICGELAKTDKGNGSFLVNLTDKLSTLTKEEIFKYTDMEERE